MIKMFFYSLFLLSKKRILVIKKTSKEIAIYAGFAIVISLMLMTYHYAWTPIGAHTLVSTQAISDKHGWLVFEDAGCNQKKILTQDLVSIPIGSTHNLRASLIYNGFYKLD